MFSVVCIVWAKSKVIVVVFVFVFCVCFCLSCCACYFVLLDFCAFVVFVVCLL